MVDDRPTLSFLSLRDIYYIELNPFITKSAFYLYVPTACYTMHIKYVLVIAKHTAGTEYTRLLFHADMPGTHQERCRMPHEDLII